MKASNIDTRKFRCIRFYCTCRYNVYNAYLAGRLTTRTVTLVHGTSSSRESKCRRQRGKQQFAGDKSQSPSVSGELSVLETVLRSIRASRIQCHRLDAAKSCVPRDPSRLSPHSFREFHEFFSSVSTFQIQILLFYFSSSLFSIYEFSTPPLVNSKMPPLISK